MQCQCGSVSVCFPHWNPFVQFHQLTRSAFAISKTFQTNLAKPELKYIASRIYSVTMQMTNRSCRVGRYHLASTDKNETRLF